MPQRVPPLDRPTRRHRRRLLQTGLGLAGLAGIASLGAAPALTWARGPEHQFKRYPFTLGIASGYPTADGMVLWTRLAPVPLAPDGGMPLKTVAVVWELARDEHLTDIVRSGTVYASPDWAHSVHVEVSGLPGGARPYWYRFRAGGAVSPIGRTATTAPQSAALDALRFALVCCQHYEHGYFNAYRRMANENLDLIVHVGDYIYERSTGHSRVRSHGTGECFTLEDYRLRHGLYRTDPDLQAAHAACPWLLTWDDHDVNNDYAGDISEEDDPPALFRARRAAAYRAYYEHLPLPRRAVPFGPDARIFATLDFGQLAQFQLLDERQYRSPQACPLPGQHGSNNVSNAECPDLSRADRTMLGPMQEAWLGARLQASTAQWNLVTQGVLMAYAGEQLGHGRQYWTDAWNGYPAARARLIQQLANSRAANPVILSGDSHAFVISDINLRPAEFDSPIATSELLTSSITSDPPAESLIQGWLPGNPNMRLATGKYRGYIRVDLDPAHLQATLVAMNTTAKRDSGRPYAEILCAGIRSTRPAARLKPSQSVGRTAAAQTVVAAW